MAPWLFILKLHACAPPLQSNPRILHNLFPSKNEKCEHNRFFAPRRLHNRFLARLITHRHTDTQTNIHTDTTQRHSDKQTHRHTDTQAYIHSRHTDTQPHMSVCVARIGSELASESAPEQASESVSRVYEQRFRAAF